MMRCSIRSHRSSKTIRVNEGEGFLYDVPRVRCLLNGFGRFESTKAAIMVRYLSASSPSFIMMFLTYSCKTQRGAQWLLAHMYFVSVGHLKEDV